jgi:hypothetical protein
MGMAIFHVQYLAEPEREAKEFGSSGGACINCRVRATSVTEAQEIAIAAIRESHWRVLSVEEDCLEVTEDLYSGSEESLECFRQATLNGEYYVYHQWPNEPQDDDVVH